MQSLWLAWPTSGALLPGWGRCLPAPKSRFPSTQVAELERDEDGRLTLICDKGTRTPGLDAVIWAIGRTPNTDDLHIEAAGLERDAQGFVPTDGFQDTQVPGIYALGDITGREQLTPVAIVAGRRLADAMAHRS